MKWSKKAPGVVHDVAQFEAGGIDTQGETRGELIRIDPDMSLEEKVPLIVEDHLAQTMDQSALMAAILAQREDHLVPMAGPVWSSQVIPPAIPGTINYRYTRTMIPLRVLAFLVLWITWHWTRGLFVAATLVLLFAVIVTR